jgi:DNA mismatch endonuclease (patch repair protein)
MRQEAYLVCDLLATGSRQLGIALSSCYSAEMRADLWSKKHRSLMMSLIRGKGNKETEQTLLALLKRDKITGWRRHLLLPGKPDFAFPKQKVAVFVDGCFWHGCPKCYTRPKTNRAFWDRKREQNMARDRRVDRQLRRQGWKVIRIWQHSLQKSPFVCLTRIHRVLQN